MENIDVSQIVSELDANKDLWKVDDFYKKYPIPIFKEIDTLTLRYCKEGDIEGINSSIYHLFESVREEVSSAMFFMRAERIGAVMVNKLPPGASIPEHTDVNVNSMYYHRFHLVVETNDDVVTTVGGEEFKMNVGELWLFDYTKPHSFVNNGSTDRIHIVFDMKLFVAEELVEDLSGLGNKYEGWSHFAEDDIFIKQMPLMKAGDFVNGHAHTYSHTSLLATGKVRMMQGEKHIGDFTAPEGILVPANEQHEFIALEDNTILYCVHNMHEAEKHEVEDKLIKERHT